jgi:hypothetical protein
MFFYNLFIFITCLFQVVGRVLVKLAPQLARDNEINIWANDESDIPYFPLTNGSSINNL